MEKTIQALRSNGFDARVFSSADQAAAYLLSTLPKEASVGIGGSMTVKEMGLFKALKAQGHPVYWHWECPKEEVDGTRAKAAAADTYLTSANALTRTGILINSDGFGNRVAASFYGPSDVWFLVGRNKLVDTLEAGIERIREVASPLNAKRLNHPVNARLHNVTILLEAPTPGRTMHVLLIDEDLGY